MSNSRILSKVPSDLANTANGKLLSIHNGEIIWQQNHAWDAANTGISIAQAAFDSSNNVGPQIEPAFFKANSAFDAANTVSSNLSANVTIIQGVNDSQNTRIDVIDGINITQNTNIENLSTWLSSNNNLQASINTSQNTFSQASFAHANASFNSSNTKFSSSGGIIDGSVQITGDLIITGNNVSHSSNNVVINDPIILLANNNPGNLLDLGYVAHYKLNGDTLHTGLIRHSVSNTYYLFENYLPHIQETNILNINDVTFRTSNFVANNITATSFSGLGTNLTSLTAGNLSGTIPSGVLGNSTHFVGTTSIALNRGSASQTLTGVSIDGSAGSVANALTINNGGSGASSGTTFNGSSAVTISHNTIGSPQRSGISVQPESSVSAGDVRNLTNPTTGLGYFDGARFRFSSLNDDNSTPYADVIDLSTYSDSSGGGFNALYLGKNSQLIYHKYAAAGATSWTTKTIAYTDSLSSYLPLAGGTMTGQFISTDPYDAAAGGGNIFLNSTTGNRIDFNTNGVAAPAFTTRSAGTKIVLYPNVGAASVDFALGIESNNLWFSTVDNTNGGFKWYHGTTNTMSLLTTGILSVVTGFRINNAATSGQYLRGNGTNFVSSAIQAADVPTLNQNTTGSAGSVAWSGVTSKPTTLAGYGITNALIRGGGIGNIDFNAQRTLASGIYSVGDALTNGPPASAYSNFIQMYERGDTAAQLVIEYSSGRMYSRGIQTATPTYSPWRTQIDDGNYTSYAMPVGSSATNSVDVRAPIFYDSNNTAYYIDPHTTGTSCYLAGDLYVGMGKTSSDIYMGDTDEGTRRLHCNSNRIGFLNSGNGWGSWCHDDGWWQSDSSVRAPIFYDSDDTGYYVNPNGFSQATYLRLLGGWSGSGVHPEQLTVRGTFASMCLRATNGNQTYWLIHNDSSNAILFYGGTGGADGTSWTNNFSIDQSGNATARGNVTAYSDVRLKTNIKPIKDSITTIKKLRGVTFNWISDNKPSIGLIAQEVEEILPELVVTGINVSPGTEIREEVKSVDYGKIISICIEAIKEQQTQLEQQQETMNKLKLLLNLE
jgi:hypothetical protein